jgi:hypothetical protein
VDPCFHLLAHQGGWDEILLFAGPALAVIGFVVWAERKARARKLGQEAEESSATIPGRDDPENET